MKIRIALVIAFSLLNSALRAEKISLVGATVINPADGKVLPNATIVINGNKIERLAMGKQDASTLGKQISCVGKFILPGYIDTHVHFFQSADLFTRPDGADFNSVRPYKDESRGSNRILTMTSRATFVVASPVSLMLADRCGISRSAKGPMQLRKRHA